MKLYPTSSAKRPWPFLIQGSVWCSLCQLLVSDALTSLDILEYNNSVGICGLRAWIQLMSRRYSGRQTEADSHGEGSQRTVCLALAVWAFWCSLFQRRGRLRARCWSVVESKVKQVLVQMKTKMRKCRGIVLHESHRGLLIQYPPCQNGW